MSPHGLACCIDAQFAADDAKYVTFPFQPEMDAQLVRRYVVDVRPAAAEHTPESTGPKAEREEKE